MMRRLFILTIALMTAIVAMAADYARATQVNDVEQARALAARLSARLPEKIEFRKIESDNGKDVFTLASDGGKVIIGGNNAGSMAVGLNRYLNRYCKTTVSWYADVAVELPKVLPEVPATERVTARVPQRFFLNYCTWGYTMPFWQWHDWERFIDWMALNGVNLPLAITGQEAVWYNVWTKLGMNDKQVRSYFTGPAYLPWHRMANIDGWCGPLPKEWLDNQTTLQQRIVERERALNMRPVLPAFAGHVPGALRELFPDADIQALGSWAGFDDQYRTFFLNSEDPLYSRIQRMFLEEQTRLFGTDHIYGIDPFNEVDPPSFEPDYLNKVTKHIYESLTAVDPEAEWLQMAWFLYYQRKDYTPERTRAMLTGVPQGKMTMLDYYCEYKEMWREHKGFYGQPFIWCYLGNFGGNTNVQGRVKEAGERIERALQECGDNLVGIGSTLEGLDLQQFPYEYILEKAWDYGKSDAQVISELADRHAGRENKHALEAWQLLYDNVLDITPGNFAAPLTCSYPVMGKESRAVKYEPRQLLAVWDALLAQDQVTTDAMTIDLVWVGRQLLGDLFLVEKQALDKAFLERNQDAFYAHSNVMYELLSDIDDINSHHPQATLAGWLQQARDMGNSANLKNYYEMNARSLITTWGGSLNDYACRNWSGLMWDYYAKRWEIYMRKATVALLNRHDFDKEDCNAAVNKFQQKWVASTEYEASSPINIDVLTHCRQLREKYRQELESWVSQQLKD
ncbi:MAG: alpha-N-acetylglucosaminidase [Muribaculaceae bacterium]|nr:alpha-N-acetylglucosaminidase [Muribaculaceae bacterium]